MVLLLGFGSMLATATSLLVPTAAPTALDGIDFIMGFGDSYTANGWNPALGLNPIKGQTLSTTSGGLTWIEYLAASTSAKDTWYDFAAPGASSAVVYTGVVPDFVAQVTTFEDYSEKLAWNASTTLFSIFLGINDMYVTSGCIVQGFAYVNGQSFPVLLDALFASYSAQVARLYASGARRFLILNVPPTDQTPLVQSYGALAVLEFQTNVALWNAAMEAYILTIPALHPGAVVSSFDTHALFSTVLSNPLAYGFLNANTYCTAYSTVLNNPFIYSPTCASPLQGYFWWNGYHPTWPVQALIAQGVEILLNTTPSKKVRRTKASRIEAWH